MRWARITLTLPTEAVEPALPILEGAGCEGVEVVPAGAQVRLVGYIPADDGLQQQLERIKIEASATAEEFGSGGASLSLSFVDEEDWASTWKTYFKPLRVGRRFIVCPSWEDAELGPDDLLIDLDPGMAFGSGTHESTQLCIEALEDCLKPGDRIIDVGTGSGILAIAAARLGAAHVEAVDIDQLAVEVARENVARNGVRDVVEVHEGDLLDDALVGSDLIVANIIAPVVARLIPTVARLLRPGGTFIGAGIVEERFELVENAIPRLMPIQEVRARGEWRCIIARKLEKPN